MTVISLRCHQEKTYYHIRRCEKVHLTLVSITDRKVGILMSDVIFFEC